MDINHSYWEENSNIHQLKYESCNSNDGEHPRLKDEPIYRCCDSNLNFATATYNEDDTEFNQYKKSSKVSRQDPMSHRIIEKRRRDRMNNCLADLSRLIPAEYLKKGRGRIEKTEIIEMAIRHIKFLQQAHRTSGRDHVERNQGHEQFRLGYQECMSETMRFLVEVEGYFAREALCVRLINHLQKHCDTLLLRERIGSNAKEYQPQSMPPTLLSPAGTINNTSVQSESPVHTVENGSQLRDMLTSNIIKDEIRISDSPQILRPVSPVIREVPVNVPLTRIPTPENENHYDQQKHPDENKPGERIRNISENENYSNGVSLYKFKNNIKERFSQDLNAETNQTKMFNKRRKTDQGRRNSVTTEAYSSENLSSPIDGSQCSPPGSEMYRVSSESENRISPTGSSVSDIRNFDRSNRCHQHLKPENHIQKNSNGFEYSASKNNYLHKNNITIAQNNEVDKPNFSVPIFALHAKGSFYIPLTIDYHTLVPYLQHNNILDVLPNVHNIILHPVTINVNFQSIYDTATPSVVKSKQKMEGQNGWH